jgi:hypothetical protein
LGTYRRTVSTVIPEMTKVAWDLEKDKLAKASPPVTEQQFRYNLSRAGYEKEWGSRYEKPGAGAQVLAFVFRILPKVGPLRYTKPKPPTPKTNEWFEESFDKTMTRYRGLLSQVGAGRLQLANLNFDTGKPTQPATYKLADYAYSKLAIKLAARGPAADPKITADVVDYFYDRELPFWTKRDPDDWRKTLEAVDKLKNLRPSTGN